VALVILLFCLGAVAGTYLPLFGSLSPKLSNSGKDGLTVTSLSDRHMGFQKHIEQMGVRPLLQGILLWAIVATSFSRSHPPRLISI